MSEQGLRINITNTDIRIGQYSSGQRFLELSDAAVERIAYRITPMLSGALMEPLYARLSQEVPVQVMDLLTAAMEQQTQPVDTKEKAT